AEDVAGRIAPRRTQVLLVAGEEIEVERRLVEQPLAPLAAAEHVAEQVLGLLPVQEMILRRRPLVGVARRDGDALDTKPRHEVEEFGHAFRLGIVEQGAVYRDAEPALDRLLHRLYRAVE